MNGMSAGGVIKGGLLAGLVINVGEFLLNGVIIAQPWEEAMAAMGAQQGPAAMTLYVVGAFVMGVVALWLYAAARPRLGAGPMTAVKVGLVVWLMAWAWPILGWMAMGIVPQNILWISLVWGLVEVPLAVVVGAWIYKEEGAAAAA